VGYKEIQSKNGEEEYVRFFMGSSSYLCLLTWGETAGLIESEGCRY